MTVSTRRVNFAVVYNICLYQSFSDCILVFAAFWVCEQEDRCRIYFHSFTCRHWVLPPLCCCLVLFLFSPCPFLLLFILINTLGWENPLATFTLTNPLALPCPPFPYRSEAQVISRVTVVVRSLCLWVPASPKQTLVSQEKTHRRLKKHPKDGLKRKIYNRETHPSKEKSQQETQSIRK